MSQKETPKTETLSFAEALTTQPTHDLQVAVPEPKTPVTTDAPALGMIDGLDGEFTVRDLRFPRVSLIHPISEVVKQGRVDLIGKYLLDGNYVIGSETEPWEGTALRLVKVYQEDVPFGGDMQPRVFNRSEEVLAAGGSLRFGDENFFFEVLHVHVAIKMPANMDPEGAELFVHQFNRDRYATAVWTLQKSAFANAGRTLITWSHTLLRPTVYSGKFLVSSQTRSKNKNTWKIPSLKFAGKHSPEAVEFFKSLL